jgi:L-alanine-DL-glutamate epimerase-like enolase superfamily enzyme
VAGGPSLGEARASAYTVPTDKPESDGTFAWDKTTIIVAEVAAGGQTGLGYTYADKGVVDVVHGTLASRLEGRDAMDIPGAWQQMRRAIRNLGASGVAACAVSALDAAMWDLKSKLLGQPLALLLGRMRDAVPIYGSGGFCSYTDRELQEQLGGWVERDGCAFVKMKVGRDPERDPERVRAAREAINGAELFVDANGALSPRQAIQFAGRVAPEGVTWFEEPVSSGDLAGMRFVRERAPAGMDVAAGEYVYVPDDVRRMLESGAVDVQQADATRCLGVTGFLRAAALCDAFHTAFSGHCAPALHLHPACSAPRLRHLEWFHDHVRIEHMLFDGAPRPQGGAIRPDLSRPGLGLELKRKDAERYAAR